MCGIAGMVARRAIDEKLLQQMAMELGHRGPDDIGIWTEPEARIGLVQRRLAIVDLSPAGHQPMTSADGRWVLNFNGEIYNHSALRAELEAGGCGPGAAGRPWRGHSDSETLVECIAAWGLARTLARCAGMFAISLWDASERRLHLVRDRFGEKPLYYGWIGNDFVFASELKALRLLPGFDNPVCRLAVGRLARLGYVPEPWSIHERIFKLTPGCILSAGTDELRIVRNSPPLPGQGLVDRYWCYRDVVRAGLADPLRNEREAVERLEATLLAAVRDQAMADVPVGAFLSGGVDSSTVVALYRRHSPVKTFTIGFEDAAFDEAPYARAVAAHLGTDHHEVYVTAAEAREVIPLLPRIYDEPFADSSQIPTYLVCRHARSAVTVALSGDGGDELFGGYNRYLAAPRLWARLRRLPRPARAAAARLLGAVPAGAWNAAADFAGRRSRQPHFGAKIQRTLRSMARADGLAAVHESFIDEWGGQASPVAGDDGDPLLAPDGLDDAPDAVRMMYLDAVSYLPGDILAKVDRAAMAVSLETRLPLLDHRVAELAARIPITMKIEGGVGKGVLRRILYRHVPAALIERPKTGFAVPIGDWLRGPLRDWAEHLLDERRLREAGWFSAGPVRSRWRDHLAGHDAAAALWHVLMFQAWSAETGSQTPAAVRPAVTA